MREKGLVGELGLVLKLDPVPGLMVLHSMLQDHDFKHFLGFGMGELAHSDDVGSVGGQSMDTLSLGSWQMSERSSS